MPRHRSDFHSPEYLRQGTDLGVNLRSFKTILQFKLDNITMTTAADTMDSDEAWEQEKQQRATEWDRLFYDPDEGVPSFVESTSRHRPA